MYTIARVVLGAAHILRQPPEGGREVITKGVSHFYTSYCGMEDIGDRGYFA